MLHPICSILLSMRCWLRYMIQAIEGKRHIDKQYEFPFLLNGVNMGEEERIISKPLYVLCIAHT